MKQQKVASVPPPAPKPAPPSGPRYRYFATTPTTVTLRMRDLQIPEKARTPGYNSEQFIDLPCEEIFRGAVPKIRLSRLAELAPDCVTAKDLADEGVKVCAARLALAYMVTEERELLAEPPAPEPPPTPVPPMEEFAPPVPTAKTSETAVPPKVSEPSSAKKAEPESAAKVPELSPQEDKKTSAEPPKPPAPAAPADKKISEPETSTQKPVAEVPPLTATPPVIPPPTVKPGSQAVPSDAPAPVEAAPVKKDEPGTAPEPPATATVAAKKPFSLFPMFRRKEASDNKPSVAVPRGRIEIPKPKRPPSPITDSASEAEPEPAKEPTPEAAQKEIKPPIPKPRFEPSRSFEPKIVSAASAAPATPPKEPTAQPPLPKADPDPATNVEASTTPTVPGANAPAVLPATPVSEVSPGGPPIDPSALKMPELPTLAPKGPQRLIERMRAAEAAAKKASEPSPAAGTKPDAELPPKAMEETKVAPESKPAPVLPPPAPAPDAEILPPPAPETPVRETEIAPPQVSKPVEQVVEDASKPASPVLDVPPSSPAPTSPAPALLVETEHLSKKDAPPEIPEQDALQAIFLTEEFLSVDRVLSLCGNLPGIHSCILSQGASVIASHNAPDSVDIVSLSAHALEMLKAMRSSSAKMGIGAVPAVTVHSEKGPITFFHQDDICLLVLHKDRGFIPGVREKLQQVVDELSKAKLPLRLGGGEGKKLLGK